MDRSSSSRRLANAKDENVDPCSRKGEGAEGSDRHQVLMVGLHDALPISQPQHCRRGRYHWVDVGLLYPKLML